MMSDGDERRLGFVGDHRWELYFLEAFRSTRAYTVTACCDIQSNIITPDRNIYTVSSSNKRSMHAWVRGVSSPSSVLSSQQFASINRGTAEFRRRNLIVVTLFLWFLVRG